MTKNLHFLKFRASVTEQKTNSKKGAKDTINSLPGTVLMLKSKLRPLPAFNEKGLDDIAPTEVASAPPETEAAPDKPEDADKTFVVCFCI